MAESVDHDASTEAVDAVIVPLDGSSLAERALAPAQALAEALDARLILLTTHWEDGMGPAQDYLEQQAARVAATAVEQVVVRDRRAADAIFLAAKDPHGVVCMSTRGQGGIAQAVFGSVAEQVVREAMNPLLLIGPRYDPTTPFEPGTGTLVVGVDGSELSEASLPTAQRWARLLDLEPWIVQVRPPENEAPRAAESAYVRELARKLVDGHRPARWKVLEGVDAAYALTQEAERSRATLLAVGSHGRSGVARVLLGSVMTRVVHESSCPVLVTPPGS